MIHAYPVAGKTKSYEICEAFVQGCGGAIVTSGGLRDGPAFFYGIGKGNLEIWQEVKHSREFYYCDNSYFDCSRQEYFRITKNQLQHSGKDVSDGKRFKQLGLEIKPWSASARGHVVICPQSDAFMHDVVGYKGNWCEKILSHLSPITSRELRIRAWNRDKTALAATLGEDLHGAFGLVTWSSAAAITALLAGIPAFCESMDCAANPMVGDLLSLMPRCPERDVWAGVLADNQWTLEEFRDGTAWRGLARSELQ